MNSLFNKESLIQAIKWGAVGVLNTAVTLGVIFVMKYLLKIDDVVSNAVGYIAGFVNSFWFNKNWTFASKGHIGKEIAKFVAVFAVCYLIQLGTMLALRDGVKWGFELAQLISIVVYTGLNFVGNKLFTFKPKDDEPEKN